MVDCRVITHVCLCMKSDPMWPVAYGGRQRLPRLDHGSNYDGLCLELPGCLVVCWAWL
jgi:hypothetical protein